MEEDKKDKDKKGSWKKDKMRSFMSGESKAEWRKKMQRQGEEIDRQFGFDSFKGSEDITKVNKNVNDEDNTEKRLGWLLNMLPSTITHPEDGTEHATLDCYFLEGDGSTFKATLVHQPYFYILVSNPAFHQVICD